MSIEYGNLNQYEQEVSELINGIIGTELAIRYSEQQTKVTGVKEGTEDISWVQMWLMSNNIPGDHPAAQAVIKKIETEHAKYVKAYKAKQANVTVEELAQFQAILEKAFLNTSEIRTRWGQIGQIFQWGKEASAFAFDDLGTKFKNI